MEQHDSSSGEDLSGCPPSSPTEPHSEKNSAHQMADVDSATEETSLTKEHIVRKDEEHGQHHTLAHDASDTAMEESDNENKHTAEVAIEGGGASASASASASAEESSASAMESEGHPVIPRKSLGPRDSVPIVLTLRLRAGVAQMQGRRKEMEDAHQIANSGGREICPTEVEESCAELNDESFLAVYDGHAGSGAAEYAGKKLHHHFMDHPEFKTNAAVALKDAFAVTEKEICTNFSNSGDGTTAVVAYIRDNRLLVGHVGDSEAVLCREGKAIALTEPHNAKANAKERQRIKDAGGVLVAGETRVGHPALNPMLFSIAVTRAMGDVLLKAPEYTNGKPSGLIAEPEISEMTLTEKDEFIVLACDGVWDVMSHQECSDFVREKLQQGRNPREASIALVDHAYSLGSNDNITCVVCSFQ